MLAEQSGRVDAIARPVTPTWREGVLGPMRTYGPRVGVIVLHLILFIAAYVSAVFVRFDFVLSEAARNALLLIPIPIAAQWVMFGLYGTHRGWMRYAGLHDLFTIAKASFAALAVTVLIMGIGWRLEGTARSILLLHFAFTLLFLGAARFGVRLLREVILPSLGEGAADRIRIVIIGAGDTGAALIGEIQRTPRSGYEVVGLFDDNPKKLKTVIHGVRVVGSVADLAFRVRELDAKEIIVAAPTATGAQMRRIVEACKGCGVRYRRTPPMENRFDGRVTINQIRDVNIEDLLRRTPVQLDRRTISEHIAGRTVLVTGAAGSIGAEICQEVAKYAPRELLLVERYENALFLIERALRRSFPSLDIHALIGDVTDERRMEEIFQRHRPEIVFHSAAHKHVPLMEANPKEAIKNNVFGTRTVAELAHRFDSRRFVLISTDKAVNPTSVMGATKRVAELLIQALAKRSETKFIAVRFGNVLGSNGSVLPIFQEQLRAGGPIEITHEDMRRYFMTIPEAAQLVLQAASIGEGGEVFVLDMGDPVRILDMARDLIRLSGLSENEVGIQITGMRPGEKLFEELSLSNEGAERTRHDKIWVGKVQSLDQAALELHLQTLKSVPEDRAIEALRAMLPEYRGEPAAQVTDASQPSSRPASFALN